MKFPPEIHIKSEEDLTYEMETTNDDKRRRDIKNFLDHNYLASIPAKPKHAGDLLWKTKLKDNYQKQIKESKRILESCESTATPVGLSGKKNDLTKSARSAGEEKQQ